jgi:hypothetical protein
MDMDMNIQSNDNITWNKRKIINHIRSLSMQATTHATATAPSSWPWKISCMRHNTNQSRVKPAASPGKESSAATFGGVMSHWTATMSPALHRQRGHGLLPASHSEDEEEDICPQAQICVGNEWMLMWIRRMRLNK